MDMFNGMPKELWPSEEEHVEYIEVYRGTKSKENLVIEDFLPWFIEFPKRFENKMKQFRKVDRSAFGVSLYTSKEQFYNLLDMVPAMTNHINTISVGVTKIERGISTASDQNGHTDYFLYDYLNNNPKDDFKIIEEVKK